MIKTLTIGNVELPNRYVLAPMAGVTEYQGATCDRSKRIPGITSAFRGRSGHHFRAGKADRRTSISDPRYQYGLSGSKGRAQWRRFGVDEGSEANL